MKAIKGMPYHDYSVEDGLTTTVSWPEGTIVEDIDMGPEVAVIPWNLWEALLSFLEGELCDGQ